MNNTKKLENKGDCWEYKLEIYELPMSPYLSVINYDINIYHVAKYDMKCQI